MSQPSILMVEDDQALAATVGSYLWQNGFAVTIESRGERAPTRILAERPALVLLDLMLPGKDGIEVCRSVRGEYRGPILMLTGRVTEIDEVVGLEVGADDYLAKPVRPRILLARIRALLRRPTAPATADRRVRVGELSLDPKRRAAHLGEAPLLLTSGEFDLLFFLASRAGEVVKRAVMYEELRGTPYDVLDRSLDLMVSRLRQKLHDPASPREMIKTVRGVGYLFAQPVVAAPP